MAAKVGRKAKYFRDPKTGNEVVGLTRRKDGRWRLFGTHKTFREDDPQKAIDRFHQLKDPYRKLRKKYPQPTFAQSAVHQIAYGFSYTDEDKLWKWVGEQIRTRPQYVAEKTGVEKIAWLTDLQPPEVPPSLQEIEHIWNTRYPKADYRRRVMDAWKDFKATTAIAGLADITKPICRDYRDKVYGRGGAPKSQKNLFDKLRRLFTWLLAEEDELAPITFKRIIDAITAKLLPNDVATKKNPLPVKREVFTALLAKADEFDTVMMLMMLNGAYGISEVLRLRWDDISETHTIATRRLKKGNKLRVCVLWKETVDALAKLPRSSEYIFVSRYGERLSPHGAGGHFRRLRVAAKVKFSPKQLRSGAATAMAMGKITEEMSNTLMGHDGGISEHYVLADHTMVAPACEAIRRHYFDAA